MPATCKFNGPGLVNLVNSLPPMPAGPTTELAGKNTFPAVGRIVLVQTGSDRGNNGDYIRIRASAGGAILNSATVGEGATSLTVINRGTDAETFAIEIEAWLELVVTAATVSMLSSATINDIGATNVNNVFARFATPTSTAEAATQRAYVFETDDPSLKFYEATPQTVYGAGTASCDGVCTFYEVTGGVGAFVYAGSTSPSDDGIRYSGGTYLIYRGSEDKYSITSAAASPSLATGTWTVTNGTAPAPSVLGVTYELPVAARVAWNNGVKSYVALLTQTGTDAPVATVLENTLGGEVVWTRNNAGRYVATLAGAFTDNKTVMPGGTTTDSDGFLSGFTSTSWIDADSMKLCTQAIADLTSRADDLLLETPITIEVYP